MSVAEMAQASPSNFPLVRTYCQCHECTRIFRWSRARRDASESMWVSRHVDGHILEVLGCTFSMSCIKGAGSVAMSRDTKAWLGRGEYG